MKNLFTILVAIFLTANIFLPRQASAQSPEKMKYQAVARDNAGNVIANQLISFRISILQGSSTGVSVYSETHQATTNDFGLANLNIGNGSIVSGDFSSIAWSTDLHFLKVEMDPAGGSAFQLMGTSQLLSVPYAMHAKTADSITQGMQSLSDADGNTKIQVEKNPNEDVIRFEMAGTEFFKMDSGRFEVLNTGESVFFGEGAGANDDLSTNRTVALGYQTLFSNTTGFINTAIGYHAMYTNTIGSANTAIGAYSLHLNTTGHSNTAIGRQALFNNTEGFDNTAIGNYSLILNTTGEYNTSIGVLAMNTNTTGNNNTATGVQALYGNQNGSENTSNGYRSSRSNTTGYNNCAFGSYASYGNTTGYENTSIGSHALYNTTTAGRNVGVGYQAGFNNSTGFYNTAVGYKSGPATSNTKNSTAIGRGASTTAWNQIRIGNNIVTSIGGYTGWSNISDKRFKKAIQNDIVGLDFIMALQPVSYQLDMDKLEQSTGNNRHTPDSSYKETEAEREFNLQSKIEKGSIRQSGFIAQDVELAAESVGYDFSGVDKPKNEDDFYGLRYAEFVVPLVKALQEQQELIEQQNINYEKLLKRVAELEQKKTNKTDN